MDNNQLSLIKATVPILKEHGVTLTKHFYQRMFTHNPELKNEFNMGNQANGRQQTALATAVLAYAEHIENPSVLIGALQSIGQKHVSLNITAAQYDIVGSHLIAAIKEVLQDVATEELLEAWTIAYNQLAKIMIDLEAGYYKENREKKGGWNGWRTFIINRIVEESTEIKSFYLTPKDNQPIASYHPGQYLSVKTFVEALGHEQPRQYSLSSAFNEKYYRISVKKENPENLPAGYVSNNLHNKKVGDQIEVSAPAGLFHIGEKPQQPLVLISGGVGITPMMSILEAQAEKENKIVWLHSCRNENVQAFKNEVNHYHENFKNVTAYTFFNELASETKYKKIGFMNLDEIKKDIILPDAKYYVCGPQAFIKAQFESLKKLGVQQDSIFYEEFGPQLLNLN
ncbi:NO-inducible flavohemoprotein [Flavobacterium terrae]|uniref:Flavohemoprotein n=1 Tax=Flavobacterium terrae TaxID=415425 RepID=A0A1M6CHZ0_9FLAO|nr:NO-inducible flavohemoprotein [Flavobacterium terrae]SHI60642.1 nitric oxide dioxygenase [Flavobacterium terrae]